MRNKLKLILFGLIILMFTGGAMAAASLSGGAIDSSTGYIDTTFDFTVTYTDTDNISASYVNVAIDGTPYAMAETDSGDVNTSDGKDYAYSNSGFTVGTHSYEFYADNGGGEVGPFDAGTFTISNTAPVLSSSGVSPGSGSPATSFTFSVTYTDADNNASSYMNVTIDGVSYAMSESDAGDTDYTDGKVYSYSSTFATGTHTYNFSASDGVDSVGPTADDTFSVNSDSSISGTVSPSSGTPSDTFYFNATFTDADNDLPTYIRAIINGTTYDMNEVDAGDVTTTDGKLYTYSITGFPIGSHTYKFTASDGTSTPETAQQSFDVDVSNHQPTLTDDEVTADSFIVGESIFFNVIYTDSDNDAPSFNYVQIDGTNKTMFKVDSDDDTATNGIEYTYNTTLALGTHTYRFFASDGTYEVNTASKNVTIYSKTYFTGDRIWDVNANQSDDYYIWDAKSFSGFFYDLESGLSSENMTIKNIARSIDSGDIIYQTRPVATDFEHSGWGSYQVIGFMAQKYFAAYTGDSDISGVDEVSMMSSGQLSKILLDNDDKETVYSGSSLILEDGYELNIVQVDVNGDKVLVTLTKDGDDVDEGVVSSNSDYIYQTDLGDADDVVMIAVHFDSVFSGTESNAVFVQGVFQISDDYTELNDGDSVGEMEVTSIGDDLIQMTNDGSISLSKGKTVTLMGKIKLIVADNDDLRFAPYVDMSDPGTYELRGTVLEDDSSFTWNPLNFEGFYYDIDEGIQTETLKLDSISGRTIADGGLVYTSTPASVEFEHSDWGDFQVIGFMAEKYFAGYTSSTDISGVDDVSLMGDGLLSKVLLDDDDKTSVYSGSSLILENGYELSINQVDVNGEKVLVTLSQDGDDIEDSVVASDSDYVYEKDLGSTDNVPIIIVHFNEVFSGSESNAVFIQGIFQISDDYTELEDGDTYGKMKVSSFGSTSIVMDNDDTISLSSGKDISLMGDVGIKVADDSSNLRYYPYVEVTTAASQALSISLSDSTVTEGDDVTITVTSRGSRVTDATVKVEGTTIGTTDDEGTIDYNADEVGTLKVTASKDGYTSASKDIEVIDKDDETKKMSIEVSPEEVYEGSSMTIYVLQAIGGDEIAGATVTFDGSSIGTTDIDGSVTYTATEAGTHKIKATKSGMNDAELDFKVNELAAEFEFSNLEISPLEIKQGQEATITADVVNTGTAEGSYNVELKVNDVIVDSQTITLSVGNSTTVEFTHEEEEPGTYEVQLGDLTTTYEVFEKSGTILYVLGAIGLAAIGGVAYLFTAGGWTVEIAQAKAAEAVEAIKELIGK